MGRLKCTFGHEWDAAEASAAPLVCPRCGRPPAAGARRQSSADEDSEKTLDADAPAQIGADSDRTMDLPPPSEVTQTMHFTLPAPPPAPPSVAGKRSEATAVSASGRADSIASMGGSASRRFGDPAKAPGAAGSPAAIAFAIIRQHAKGGLGVVNLARDGFIGREVALKQILPQHADNAILKRRFLYEAQITGQLEHPSIVPVYCLGSDDVGNPYYVMRFVKGRTLDEIIKEHHAAPNPIVFRELLRRYIAVCQAVAYAHSRGVIHRDLKPANVMLGDYGETLVLDWGLAKDIKQGGNDPALWGSGGADTGTRGRGDAARIAGEGSLAGRPPGGSIASTTRAASLAGHTTNSAELTMQGQIIGTPAYMAPEQAEGRIESHGPVTDIYALGGILYKILTGQSPQAPTSTSTGSTRERRFTFVPSPPPSTVNPDVDPQIEAICTRAMSTEPVARYQRALELAQDIQRWLDEHPLINRPRTATGKLTAILRARAPWIVAGLLTIILALAVLLAIARSK